MKAAAAAALLVGSLVLGSMPAVSIAAEIPDVPGWELSFHDEFDGNSLDTDFWEAMHRKDSFNNEKQYYLPSQVEVEDGNLKLTATNQPFDGKQYRSGLITSKDLYGPGRFEARINLPTTQGMWPAFWLNANQVAWPTGGEIDIMENRGSQPFLTSSAYHWQNASGNHQYSFHEYTAEENGEPVRFHGEFHTYAVEWEANRLRFYVDGNLHSTMTGGLARPIHETPKNIILNLAVGGLFGGDPNGSTVFPQEMLVDYVRVWQKQVGIQGDYNNNGAVDAADYTIWRDSVGQEGIGLAADGSGNGKVDESDFLVWRTNFGVPSGAGSGLQTVPEPATLGTLCVGLLLGRRWILGNKFRAYECRSDRGERWRRTKKFRHSD